MYIICYLLQKVVNYTSYNYISQQFEFVLIKIINTNNVLQKYLKYLKI